MKSEIRNREIPSGQMNSLPWRTSDDPPPRNLRVLVLNDSNQVGLGVYTGTAWHTDFTGSCITHWCGLESIPRPASPPSTPAAH